jgi:hypothetical protein
MDGSRDPIASRRLDDLVRVTDIRIEPVTEQQVRIARDAYRDFGKETATRLSSIPAIVLPMPWPRSQARVCFIGEMIFPRRISLRKSETADTQRGNFRVVGISAWSGDHDEPTAGVGP